MNITQIKLMLSSLWTANNAVLVYCVWYTSLSMCLCFQVLKFPVSSSPNTYSLKHFAPNLDFRVSTKFLQNFLLNSLITPVPIAVLIF